MDVIRLENLGYSWKKGEALAVPELLDMTYVESAKNGMMFLPLESDKLKHVYPRK